MSNKCSIRDLIKKKKQFKSLIDGSVFIVLSIIEHTPAKVD